MKEIPLAGRLGAGMVALVDDADFEWLSQFRWNRVLGHGRIYAGRCEKYKLPNGKGGYRSRQMQSDILYPGRPCPKGMKADHIDRNPLNNQRHNLRLATDSESNLNRRLSPSRNRSGYRGIYQDKTRPRNSWSISMSAGGKHYSRSGFATPEEAAAAYNSLARHHHGDNAQLNVLPDGLPQFLDEAIKGRSGRRCVPRKSPMDRDTRPPQEVRKAVTPMPEGPHWNAGWWAWRDTPRDGNGTES